MRETTVENVMEQVVEVLVGYLLHGPDYQAFCHCGQCERDIIAIALNALPTKYVGSQTDRDRIFIEINTPEYLEFINKEIIHAIHIVGSKPRH